VSGERNAGLESRQGATSAGQGSFGRILLDLGLLTPGQLDSALRLQQERSRRGDFARLGHILVEEGYLTPAQVQQVLQAQAITILTCEACSSQFNIRGFSPDRRYECPRCHCDLRPPEALQDVAVQDQLDTDTGTAQDDTVRLTRGEDDVTKTERIRQLRLLGKYEILGEIARGGMGIIYKARQLDLDRVVALKTLRQEELGKPDAAERFRGEAQAVARLRHPNIVAVHEVGSQDGIEYFTMDLIEGLSLDRQVLRSPLAAREAVDALLPIAEALDYAHQMGVVHRDLKPANIIVDLEGVPFLVDWGIAKRMDLGRAPDEEEDLLGSIPYMSPEYVEGAEYDELCDLYSLGVVLYEVLAGPNALPYYDPDTRRFLEKIMCEPHKPILEHVPDLDPELARIVEGMIARREERYPAMHEVVQALRRWQVAQEEPPPTPRPQPAAAPPPSPEEVTVPIETEALTKPRRRPRPRDPVRVALGVGLGLALAALAGAVWSLTTTRADLREARRQLDLAERARAEAVLGVYLDTARTLRRADARAEALAVADEGIRHYEGRSLGRLAELHRLRAALREATGARGAAQDRKRAARIEAELGGE